MPNLLWDLLATRLGGYLQLSYVTPAVAGTALAAEIAIRTLDGPPVVRRKQVVDWFEAATTGQKSILLVVLLVVAFFAISFAAGIAVRYLVGTSVHMVRTITSFLSTITGFRRHKFAVGEKLRGLAEVRDSEPSERPRHYVVVNGQALDTGKPMGALLYAWELLRRRPRGREVWHSLVNSYGEDRVKTALKRHPITTPVTEDWQIHAVGEYCFLWLRRFAPDMAITPSATRSLVVSTLFIPALLLPGTLRQLFGDLSASALWIDRSTPMFFVILMYLLLTSFRDTGIAAQLFHRFVVVQLMLDSDGRSPTDEPEPAS